MLECGAARCLSQVPESWRLWPHPCLNPWMASGSDRLQKVTETYVWDFVEGGGFLGAVSCFLATVR